MRLGGHAKAKSGLAKAKAGGIRLGGQARILSDSSRPCENTK